MYTRLRLCEKESGAAVICFPLLTHFVENKRTSSSKLLLREIQIMKWKNIKQGPYIVLVFFFVLIHTYFIQFLGNLTCKKIVNETKRLFEGTFFMHNGVIFFQFFFLGAHIGPLFLCWLS